MKKSIMLTLAILFVGPMTMAGTQFAGTYKLHDSKGKVVFEKELKLERTNLGYNKALHIYKETDAKGRINSFVCDVDYKSNKDGSRHLVETCDGASVSDLTCKGAVCSGAVQYADIAEDGSVVEINSTEKRTQAVTLKKSITVQGIKDVRAYSHSLEKID